MQSACVKPTLLRPVSRHSRKRKFSGVVTDDRGDAVIGANVVVKGTTNGTITDIDGKFSLDVPSGSTLTISYIGYLNKEIRVDGQQSQYAVKLLEDTQTLDEVVVVGFGTQKKGQSNRCREYGEDGRGNG